MEKINMKFLPEKPEWEAKHNEIMNLHRNTQEFKNRRDEVIGVVDLQSGFEFCLDCQGNDPYSEQIKIGDLQPEHIWNCEACGKAFYLNSEMEIIEAIPHNFHSYIDEQEDEIPEMELTDNDEKLFQMYQDELDEAEEESEELFWDRADMERYMKRRIQNGCENDQCCNCPKMGECDYQ